jgi:F0F1-type ATP synthase assembly protein I
MPADNDKSGRDISWRQALASVGLILGIPMMIAVPVLVGLYLDKRFDSGPLWLVVCLAVGLLGAAVDIYRLLKQFGQFK